MLCLASIGVCRQSIDVRLKSNRDLHRTVERGMTDVRSRSALHVLPNEIVAVDGARRHIARCDNAAVFSLAVPTSFKRVIA